MVISEDAEVAGSVSGGCIEGEVIRDALLTLRDGQRRFRPFGVDSETAWSVGLSCGGQVSVLVQPFDPSGEVESVWLHGLGGRRPIQVATSLTGSAQGIRVGDRAVGALEVAEGETGVRENEVFVHRITPPDRLLIVGGADIAVHLTAMASRVDFEVTVLDPRAVFTDPSRFDVRPSALITGWPQEVLPDFEPDESTYAVLLTHDPRIDDPALHALLLARVPHIGALGGRKTQSGRRERMELAGFSSQDIARIRGPVGLSIGAAAPAEIAASILAEVIAVRNGRVPHGVARPRREAPAASGTAERR